jgi:hypothetical protein
MTERLEYLAHCPDRTTFVTVMTSLQNPLTGAPLATEEDGVLLASEGVRIDEIGPVVKTPATFDEDGEEITPAVIVPGHHVNLWAVGALADMLNANGGWDAIFALLGDMQEMPPTEDGVPQGWQGSSGMRIYPRNAVQHPVRVWA